MFFLLARLFSRLVSFMLERIKASLPLRVLLVIYQHILPYIIFRVSFNLSNPHDSFFFYNKYKSEEFIDKIVL